MKTPITPLGELCDMDRQGLQPDDPVASRLPFVGVENVASDTGIINFDNGSRTGSQKSATFRFDERHVLYAKLRPYLNKVATPEFAGRCSTELVPFLPRKGVDRDFIAWLLRRKETVEYVMASVTGSRMPRTDMKALMSLTVPLPPLNEQRRIADILNRAAKIERLRAQAEQRLRKFIPALFIRMFGDPETNPMRWDVVRIRELSPSIESGFACGKSNLVEVSLPHLRPFNIGRNGEMDLTKTYNIPFESVPLSKISLNAGDILFNNTNSRNLVGKTALVRESIQAGFSNHITRVRFDSAHCEPIFVAVQLQQFWARGYFREQCTQWVSQAAFGPRQLSSMAILSPPLAEQRRFACIVNRAMRTIATAQTAANAASTLSDSLMSRLLEAGA